MRKIKWVGLILMVVMAAANAQISLTASGTTTQNFDSLTSAGTWTNNVTLSGWYVQAASIPATYGLNTGSSTTAGLYSYGTSAAATDRALGSYVTNAYGAVAYGIYFVNDSGVDLTFDLLSYVGEQWRRENGVSAQSLSFYYLVSDSAISLTNVATGWTQVSALTFTSPNNSGATSALDGTAAANQSSLSTNLNLTITSGQYVMFKWLDANDSGNDQTLAFDDVSISYTVASAGSAGNWTGGTGYWSEAANWDGLPENEDPITFVGTTGGTATNDAFLTSVQSISFSNGAGAYTLAGDGLQISEGVVNNSSVTQIVALDLALTAAQSFNAANGHLAVSGDVNTGANLLTVTGSNNTTLSGEVSGSAGLAKTGTGTLTLTEANTYTGETVISEGVVNIANGSALGVTGAGNGTTVAVGAALELQGQITVAEEISLAGTGVSNGGALRNASGDNTLTGPIAVANGTRINSDSDLLTISGTVTGTDADLLFGGEGDIAVSGEISLGAGSLTKDGAGELSLESANAYLGGTVIQAGTVIAKAADSLGSGTVTVETGSLLATDGVTVSNDITISEVKVMVAGWDFQTTTAGGTAAAASPNTPTVFTANVGDQAGQASIYLNGTAGSSAWLPATELNSFSGTAINAGAGMSTVTTGAASLALLAGGTGLPANGQSIVFGFDMSGLKDLSVSYATRYSSSQGFTNQTWEYSLDGIDWFSLETITVSSDSFALKELATIFGLNDSSLAYLRLTVDGAVSETSNNRLDNIQLNAISSEALATLGSAEAAATVFYTGNITLDGSVNLTAAVDGVSIFSGDISGDGGAVKTGAGTVFVSGTNSYTGGTTVSVGTLVVNNSATALGTGSVAVAAGATLSVLSVVIENDVTVEAGGNLAATGAGLTQAFVSSEDDIAFTKVGFDTLTTPTGTNVDQLISEVLTLDGNTGETFVLQMTYDSALAASLGGEITLTYYDSGSWVNAVLGNIGGTANFVAGAYDSSLFTLGNYGFDAATNTAWAVLNHNSQFAVAAIPEPSTYALLGLGLLATLLRRRRRLV